MDLIIRLDDEDKIYGLYEASMRECVSSLNTLVGNDPLILHKISLTSLTQTTLLIPPLLGHLDSNKAILIRKPELDMELDSFKHSPLHMAWAGGHVGIVRKLASFTSSPELATNVNKDVCLVADQDGRIPLHLAAIKGRVGVTKELVSAKTESIFVMPHGDSVLHLCVRFNQLEVLKLLLTNKNHEANSILQLPCLNNSRYKA